MARDSATAAGDRATARGSRVLVGLVRALRPRQWTKNLLVFAALIFSRSLLDADRVGRVVATFVIFCLLSGATYLLNDTLDRERDRAHPRKRHRPIASGAVPVWLAVAVGVGLLAGACGAAFALGRGVGLVALGYALLLSGYSLGLKHLVIVDALVIASGFVLRAVAGVVAIGTELSHWLLLCTVLLALFLTFGKRRHELVALDDGGRGHRPILVEYSPQLLDQMIAVVTASTLMAYALYTMAPETQAKVGSANLLWTIPFVLYGLFRYLYLLYRRDLGGDPSEHLITDRALLLAVALWGGSVLVVIYLGH